MCLHLHVNIPHYKEDQKVIIFIKLAPRHLLAAVIANNKRRYDVTVVYLL